MYCNQIHNKNPIEQVLLVLAVRTRYSTIRPYMWGTPNSICVSDSENDRNNNTYVNCGDDRVNKSEESVKSHIDKQISYSNIFYRSITF